MTQEARPAIPEPVKRSVRQRCGFGCVICGLPIYEYDHMAEYAEEGVHSEDNLTLLCPTHHAEKTKGLLPIEVVRGANADPLNLRNGYTSPWELHYTGITFGFKLGKTRFIPSAFREGDGLYPLIVDGHPLIFFKLSDGHLLLNIHLYNEYNELVLRIEDNELVHCSDVWDITLIGPTLTLRSEPRALHVVMTFNVPTEVVIERGVFYKNGVRFIVDGERLIVPTGAGGFFGELGVVQSTVGFVLGTEAIGHQLIQVVGGAIRVPKILRSPAPGEAQS